MAGGAGELSRPLDLRGRAFTLAGASGQGDGEVFEIYLPMVPYEEGVALGLTLEMWNGECIVLRVAPGGLAESEGSLRVGDVLRAINGVKCLTTTAAEAALQPAAPSRATKPRSKRAKSGKGDSAKGRLGLPSRIIEEEEVEEGIDHVLPSKPDGGRVRLTVMRRQVNVSLQSQVLLRMPTGEWEAFTASVHSNRIVEYEQLEPPHFKAQVLLDGLLGAPSP